MEEKLIKKLAINSVVAMIVVIATAVNLSKYEYPVIFANDMNNERAYRYDYDKLEDNLDEQEDNTLTELALLNNQNDSDDNYTVLEGLSEEYLMIPKFGEDTVNNIEILDCYMTRSVKITIDGIETSFFINNSIIKNVIGRADIEYLDEEHSNKTVIVEVAFDRLYTYNVKEDDEYYYVELLNPKSQYDKIIVIDPGHGGTAVGTHSKDEKYFEKDVNLDIVLYLKELLDKEDIKVYYTRLKDDKYLLEPRVSLANELEADMFISIHCNGDTITQSNGLEVLYGGSSGKVERKSKELAGVCLNQLLNSIETRNRGVIEGNARAYILRNSIVPACLIEVGFMSNAVDLSRLVDKEYQKKAAEGIYNAIMAMYNP